MKSLENGARNFPFKKKENLTTQKTIGIGQHLNVALLRKKTS
jgi:hypothetical protein